MSAVIRRALPSDAAGFARVMADPRVLGGTLQLPHPSEEFWRSRLAEPPEGQVRLTLAAERSGEVVGWGGLYAAGLSPRRRHAATLGIAISVDAQGQGVGTALMAALCDYADAWAALLRIELTVFADNAVAIRLYQRFGFEVEGTFKAYALRDGRYVDALTMARFHPNPPTLTEG